MIRRRINRHENPIHLIDGNTDHAVCGVKMPKRAYLPMPFTRVPTLATCLECLRHTTPLPPMGPGAAMGSGAE